MPDSPGTQPEAALVERVARAMCDARALPGTNPVARLSDVDRRAATAAIAIVVERCAFAARDALVAQEWPPQDGDKQIDDVMAAIRSLATEAGR